MSSIYLWLWGLSQEVEPPLGSLGGALRGEKGVWALKSASLHSTRPPGSFPVLQSNGIWISNPVCGYDLALKIKFLGEFKCWTHSGWRRNLRNWGPPLSLSTSPLPFTVSSIIWVIWSWGHKFLYNSNPLFRAEASGNYSDCIPDTVPKVLEQIRPSISTALLSIFRCEPGGWTSAALPSVLLCFSRATCREAPCWCWLAAASLHPRPLCCQLPLASVDTHSRPGGAAARQGGICCRLVLPFPGTRDPGLLISLNLRPSGGELVSMLVSRLPLAF